MKKILILLLLTGCSKSSIDTAKNESAQKVSTTAYFGVQNLNMTIYNPVNAPFDKIIGKQADWGTAGVVGVLANQGGRYHQDFVNGDYFVAPANMTYKFVIFSPNPTWAQVINHNPAFTIKFSIKKMNGSLVGTFKDSLNVPISYLCNDALSPSYNDTLFCRLNANDSIQIHMTGNIYTPLLNGCLPLFRNCNFYQIN